jgi:hypothetical protein
VLDEDVVFFGGWQKKKMVKFKGVSLKTAFLLLIVLMFGIYIHSNISSASLTSQTLQQSTHQNDPPSTPFEKSFLKSSLQKIGNNTSPTFGHKKVAVCMSGLMRTGTVQDVVEANIKNILGPLNADLFMFVSLQELGSTDDNTVKILSMEETIKRYSPVDIQLFDGETSISQYSMSTSNTFIKQLWHQFHNINECYKLILRWEGES